MGAPSFFALPVRNLVPSSLCPEQKKARGKSRAFIKKNRETGRSSESFSEHLPRTRTRLFSYRGRSRNKDFALLGYVMFS